MDRITLENYRCFRNHQSARLAPLTLLVGGNSTGKTSFLAIVRALWEVAFRDEVPDFQEAPYDLGTFRDVAHNRGGRGGQATSFRAGFEYSDSRFPTRHSVEGLSFDVIFEERGAFSFPVNRGFSWQGIWTEVEITDDRRTLVRFGGPESTDDVQVEAVTSPQDDTQLVSLRWLLRTIIMREDDLSSTRGGGSSNS